MNLQANKQAVFDAEGNIVGYEFFISRFDSEDFIAQRPTNRIAFITLRTLAEFGVKKAAQGRKVFIKVPIDTFVVKVFDLLEPRLMVYRIYPAGTGTGTGKSVQTRILDTVTKLKEKGSQFCATADLFESAEDLKDLIDIVEFSAQEFDAPAVSRAKMIGKKVLVVDINSPRDMERVGGVADFMMGDHLQQATSLGSFRVAPYLRSTLLRLLVMLNTARTPQEFSKVIASDAGMTAKLLRFINSAYFSLRQSINTVEQACIYFGLKNIKNFVLVLSVNDYATVENPILWKRALIRAKLMEEFTKELAPEKMGEAYLAGLMSLMDEMIGVDIVSFLREVNVDEYVILTFTDPESFQANILRAVSSVEENLQEILSAGDISALSVLREVESELGIAPHVVLQAIKSSIAMADTIINH